MQLKITSDYAVRCVLYLAMHAGSANAESIGKSMGITPNYAQRILQRLKSDGIVYSIQGNGGGYVLAKRPEEIRMMDLLKTQEQTLRINRCLEDDGYCSRNGVEKNCPIHDYYQKLQDMMDDYLMNTTISDLLHQRVTDHIEKVI